MMIQNLDIKKIIFLAVCALPVWAANEAGSRPLPPLPVANLSQGGAPAHQNNFPAATPKPVFAPNIASKDAPQAPNMLANAMNADQKVLSAEQSDREKAFEILKQSTVPLTTDQILELRKLLDSSQRAAATPAATPPRPVSSSLVINLSPGVTPPVIRLASGYVSSLVFVDSTGAPWPIVSYGLGNPEAFNIQWDMKSNMMMLQSVKAYASGNLAVKLYGNPTPVMLSIVTGQKEVDYRVDLQVLGRGPHAQAPILNSAVPEKANAALINLLDGIPPQDSRLLEVEGDVTGRAWAFAGKVYYRSKLTLLSPAWIAMMSSADGTKVYELPRSPLLLASREGQTVHVRLSGF